MITSEKIQLLENEKREQLALFSSIINTSDDAIISKTLGGIVTSWNPGAGKIFGYTSLEMVGKPISILVPPNLKNEEAGIMEKIRTGKVVEHYETERIRKDGKIICVSLTISPIKDLSGNIIGASKICRDVTRKKQNEKQFAENVLQLESSNKELAHQNVEKEKRAAELVIANKELAFQNDEKGKRAAELIIANKELEFQNDEKEKRAAELAIANKELAFQNEEKEKRAAELIVANEELVFENGEKEKRAAELIIANKELAFQNTEKENRAAELIIANKELIFQNDEKENRATELVVANKELAFQNTEKEKRAEELTAAYGELKTGEEQLLSVNKELEAFSYSVSHDLRAPLRAIYGYTQMLKEDYGPVLANDGDGIRVMNNIMKSAKKMGLLVDDLLSFSRLGRRELQEQNINMDNMVNEICTELKAGLIDSSVQIHIQPLPSAMADNSMIRQVWLNLISNAVKYSRHNENPVVEIGSETKGHEITYYVKDNGAGFDMRYIDKLFGVFQRLHSEEEFEGTGVGLAIVQRVILKHKGRVWAEGKVNEGATFYFTLKKI